MENRVVNKVIHKNDTLLDLTEDTVIPEKLARNYTAHDAEGEPITGRLNDEGARVEGTNLIIPGTMVEITGNNMTFV